MRRTLAFVALLAAVSQAALAQPLDLDTPPGSPAWWPLSEATTAEELRAAYRDHSQTMARYDASLRAGRVRDLSEHYRSGLKFFYDPELSPELVPMWLALDALATTTLNHVGAEEIRAALVRDGFSAPVASLVVDELIRLDDRQTELVNEFGEQQREFIRMARTVREVTSDAEVRTAMQSGDIDFFIEKSGRDRDAVQALYDAWRRNPVLETATQSLRELSARLSSEEWSLLRSHLAENVHLGVFLDIDIEPEVNS